MIIGVLDKAKVGDLVDSETISLHDNPRRTYPPSTKGIIVREANRQEWVDYHRSLGVEPIIAPWADPTAFYEVAWD